MGGEVREPGVRIRTMPLSSKGKGSCSVCQSGSGWGGAGGAGKRFLWSAFSRLSDQIRSFPPLVPFMSFDFTHHISVYTLRS